MQRGLEGVIPDATPEEPSGSVSIQGGCDRPCDGIDEGRQPVLSSIQPVERLEKPDHLIPRAKGAPLMVHRMRDQSGRKPPGERLVDDTAARDCSVTIERFVEGPSGQGVEQVVAGTDVAPGDACGAVRLTGQVAHVAEPPEVDDRDRHRIPEEHPVRERGDRRAFTSSSEVVHPEVGLDRAVEAFQQGGGVDQGPAQGWSVEDGLPVNDHQIEAAPVESGLLESLGDRIRMESAEVMAETADLRRTRRDLFRQCAERSGKRPERRLPVMKQPGIQLQAGPLHLEEGDIQSIDAGPGHGAGDDSCGGEFRHEGTIRTGNPHVKSRNGVNFARTEASMLKRVLVTGGAGFLGSHLCDRLVALGHDVICLDNFFTSQKSNIAHLLDHGNFELIRHDVTVPINLEVDEIFNLACPAAPGHYQYNPIKTTKTSVLGAINMLGLAKRVGARILHASTSEVYGDPTEHPQTEAYRGNVNPIGPRACYDEGKRAAETLMFDYHRQNKVDIKVIRIFNTYGPRMHPYDGRVVSNFIRQALSGESITLYGDGSQTRSFCFVSDLIDGMLAMMESRDGFTGPVNLGNPHEFTIRELAEHVVRLSGSESLINRTRDLPEDDPLQRQPDITLARTELDWSPQIPLEDGVARTIDFFRSINMDEYRAPTPNY